MCQLNCNKECDGCGECKEVEPIMYDCYDVPIFESDYYWDIGDTVLSEESLEQFKKRA